MDRPARWLAYTLGAALLVFLAAPVLVLLLAGGRGAATLLGDTEFHAALATTAMAATTATVIGVVCGSPVAYVLARRAFRGRAVISALIDVPLLIPHPVAGIAILLVVSRDTPLGRALLDAGIRVVGSPIGIVCAMLFVAVPLYVSAAREAFVKVDPSYERVARTLGAGPWRVLRRVTVPLAARGMAAGAVVMWARAVSEFGAIVILAYNPKVVSVLSYDRFTTGGLPGVLPVAAVLMIVSFVPIVLVRALRVESVVEVG